MDNQQQRNKQNKDWNIKLRLEEESVFTHQQILQVELGFNYFWGRPHRKGFWKLV